MFVKLACFSSEKYHTFFSTAILAIHVSLLFTSEYVGGSQ